MLKDCIESSAFTNGECCLLAWSQLLAPLGAHLHFKTMSMFPYIDDSFHAQASPLATERTRDASVRLHLRMGFIINLKKSSLVPCQVMIHLGALIDTFLGVFRPTPGKVQEISLLSQVLLENGFISVRGLQQVVGTFAACCFGSDQFRLFCQGTSNRGETALQRPFISRIRRLRRPCVMGQIRTKSTRGSPGVCHPQSDSNHGPFRTGLGGSLGSASPRRSLEPAGIFPICQSSGKLSSVQGSPSLRACSPHRSQPAADGQHHSHVLHQSFRRDQISISRLSGQQIILWCLSRGITLRVVHLSGADNLDADRLSRQLSVQQLCLERSVEWSLDLGITQRLFDIQGSPAIDLFATGANAIAPRFYSRASDPAACQGDVLQADWSKQFLYMYPPLPLLPLALHKISREEAEVIAIIPW